MSYEQAIQHLLAGIHDHVSSDTYGLWDDIEQCEGKSVQQVMLEAVDVLEQLVARMRSLEK